MEEGGRVGGPPTLRAEGSRVSDLTSPKFPIQPFQFPIRPKPVSDPANPVSDPSNQPVSDPQFPIHGQFLIGLSPGRGQGKV